ncbi:MAG TPA: tRNA (adenosine(37)-N6)-dimethylallyltransferase MiaA [Dehalococcoidales bacterium]|nr:tRNA (adenosine(37)-N6)-dimethylallyltransferase MiaA [Dehalococcoidales bacterium]
MAVVGPTGSGKTALGIQIALNFEGEIVNADSRQIYRHMDIGTAKPSQAEMSQVPHHLFNLVNPDAEYSLAQYQADAGKVIRSILARNKLPVLVGGSGQYVLGLLQGWRVPPVPPDYELRKRLELQASDNIDLLYSRLQELDPEAALKIDKRNIRRVIRALEVCLQSGGKFSQVKRKEAPGYNTLMVGLTMTREELYRRTDRRVEEMFKQGLLTETANLLALGYHECLPAMSSIGYKQAIQVLRQEIPLDEAMVKVKNETHRYIRHQYAWFKMTDPNINWYDSSQDIWPAIKAKIQSFLNPAN